jgi:nucleotide-binding universal stress UspA family protein
MASRILLAYDGSPSAIKAFEFTLRQLRREGGELAILAVIKPSEFAVDVGAQNLIEGACALLASEMAELQRRARWVGADSTTAIRIGCPSSEILQMAREWQADLIVIGQPKRFSFARLWAGTLDRQIRERALCELCVIG